MGDGNLRTASTNFGQSAAARLSSFCDDIAFSQSCHASPGRVDVSSVGSDDVVSMLDYFQELEDPHCHINRQHLLGDLLVICVLAVIAGADGAR